MPGSGKSLVASVAASMGYTVFSMGDIVRELAREQGVEPTPANLGEIMLAIRAERGASVIALMTMEKIRNARPAKACIEGLRSIQELELFRKEFPTVVIAVHSSPRSRFIRLTARERRDDPKSHEIFEERDRREIGVGLGGVVVIADFALINEGSTEELRIAASKALQKVEIAVQTHR